MPKRKHCFLRTVVSELRQWWSVYTGQPAVFLRPSKQSITNRQTQPHLLLLKHDYMFRSTKATVTQPLQNFHCFPPYFESIVTVAWWWSEQTETCSHTSVKINVAVFDGFTADCFGNAGKVKSSPCVYWSTVSLLALDKSVDGRIRHMEEH